MALVNHDRQHTMLAGKRIGGTEAEEDLEALFKLADADGDGGISKEETM
eukprot:COSAG04_NODE_22572_length_352_cov_1.015810_1_plen_48_part_10